MFEQIVIADETGLRPWAIEKLQSISKKPLKVFHDQPKSDDELFDRIHQADCLLVSFATPIRENLLKKCTQLKYVGMCCSLYDPDSANVDVRYCRNNNIAVSGIFDYGDEGPVEFIVSELIALLNGSHQFQWKDEPVELKGRKIGIIGMGKTGGMTANALKLMGAEVSYYNRSRKPEAEQNGISYRPLHELLSHSEIISTHLPRTAQILGADEFKALGNGKIYVNTSLALTADFEAFKQWINQDDNYALFDRDGCTPFQKHLEHNDRIIYHHLTSGWTAEAKERLSQKVLANIDDYLAAQ